MRGSYFPLRGAYSASLARARGAAHIPVARRRALRLPAAVAAATDERIIDRVIERVRRLHDHWMP
jgi:hypothetical protein